MNFKFSYAKCGFKKTNKDDLALVYSDKPCSFAAAFSQNKFRSSTLDVDEKLLKSKKKIRCIVINSGNANACTGKKGLEAVKTTQKIAGSLLGIKPDEILIASTGIIGVQLDLQKMESGLNEAVKNLKPSNFINAAKAIMTTDAYMKTVSKKDKDFTIKGFAKGAGMIHPNMATMLAYFMTDLNMPQPLLQQALNEAVNNSFNVISVDGDSSTNDMVVLLSELSSKKVVKSKNDSLYKKFVIALKEAAYKLAKDIVSDGEGATKIFKVSVINAKNETDALKIARHVTTSVLFKCAVFGSDPNWGRAIARVGDAGVKLNPEKVNLSMCGIKIFSGGSPCKHDKNKLNMLMKKNKEIELVLNLNQGSSSAFALGSDLNFDYVKFNSAYFT